MLNNSDLINSGVIDLTNVFNSDPKSEKPTDEKSIQNDSCRSTFDIFLEAIKEHNKIKEDLSAMDEFFNEKYFPLLSANKCLQIRKKTVKSRKDLKYLRDKLLTLGKSIRLENNGKRGRKKKINLN